MVNGGSFEGPCVREIEKLGGGKLRHHMNKHIKNDTLCMPDIDPAMVGRSVVRTMSSFPSTFKKTDARFLEFDDKFNNVEGSFLVSDNSDRTKPSPTPKRR
ncbi:cytochrome P450 CYP82D47-like [Cucumis melo var. makuwa]|uniref:Cytochrome P450 CYP82D47-like n=1 Tax=Cucumis melo var. makuwa TaxID=1194695 RepID=A0A5A7T2D5_CUCMM|nr:cytochrome P450 CYP82D47-like [Cucumis melo var. makuwa]